MITDFSIQSFIKVYDKGRVNKRYHFSLSLFEQFARMKLIRNAYYHKPRGFLIYKDYKDDDWEFIIKI